MSLSSIPRGLREVVFARDHGRCQYCHLAQYGHGAVFHIDHIVPRSKGGATVLTNLALQCPNCSLRKANKVMGRDQSNGDPIALFHPLQQEWSEHFRIEAEGNCSGLTPTGQATVEALRMNDPIPRIARACQIRLGLI